MIVTLNFKNNVCRVIKESGDPYFKNSGWTLSESIFLYHVKAELIKQGYDVIKKRMWRDGHLVDETQQYIRTRSGLSKLNDFAIYNSQYSLWDAGIEFNHNGKVDLDLVTGYP